MKNDNKIIFGCSVEFLLFDPEYKKMRTKWIFITSTFVFF